MTIKGSNVSVFASQLRDEIERWLLPRNGALRCIALYRGRSAEDCAVLGMDVVGCNVSHHFVHDTYHTGQSRVVSSFLVPDVGLEIFRNAVSCGDLRIDHELDGHDSAVLFSPVLLICNLHSLWVLYHSLANVFVLVVSHGGREEGRGGSDRV